MFYKAEDIRAMFNLLNVNEINYVLTKNIDGDMPHKFKYGKDIDILVNPKDYKNIQAVMYRSGYNVTIHPCPNEGFMYGAHEDINMINPRNNLIVHAFAQLCVKSISMNIYVPLDKVIQKSIWENKVWDTANQWWIMDDENILIHLLSKSIFNKNIFTEAYIREIEKRKYLLMRPTARQKFEKIFFKFTDTLIEKVSKGRYGEILLSYLTFTNY